MSSRTRLVVNFWLGRRVETTSRQADPAAALRASMAAILAAEKAMGMPPVAVPANFPITAAGHTAPTAHAA